MNREPGFSSNFAAASFLPVIGVLVIFVLAAIFLDWGVIARMGQ